MDRTGPKSMIYSRTGGVVVKIKICGITRQEDAVNACECGADILGFIFVKGTVRYVSPERVRGMVKNIRYHGSRNVGFAGLFKDEDPETVVSISLECGLDHVQLQGQEDPGSCEFIKKRTGADIMKVFKVRDRIMSNGPYFPRDYPAADYLVFDTFHPDKAGGTGTVFEWGSLMKAKSMICKPFFLAGGLDPYNVSDAIRRVDPYGVDVSSGVEKVAGEKDAELLKEFVSNARKNKEGS